MRLVLASNNPGKLAELQGLFAGLGIELVTQGSLGIGEAEEPHAHLRRERARQGAACGPGGQAARRSPTTRACVVDALGGAPGVVSAHFAALAARFADREAERRAQDAANNALLLERLQGRSDRSARFVSTLVALRHAADPEPLIATGRWPAEIALAPRGSGGFGYDPLVFIPALGKTVAELDAAAKNAVSHRALAARQMRALMRDAWNLG